ncbi:MAG TPA: 5-(carboxyamino)imidazole ribonucleotide synthase, partial [Methylophilaceae bacterium]|nr:5-(carboxyamino)imidazole ribonucleotide synthase [Methylophilaceae bacterium]
MSQLDQPLLPSAMLGILGGGQLGRFFVMAAHEMGYKVTVLDPDPKSPAGAIADIHLCKAFDDSLALEEIRNTCQAVTTEFENVSADSMDFLSKKIYVSPSAESVRIAQYRVLEKTFLKEAGLPVGPFEIIREDKDIPSQTSSIYPAILKVARFGYDGKGQARVATQKEAIEAFHKFSKQECVLEKMLPLDMEVSLVLARDQKGHIKTFNVSENIHTNGILDISIVPARSSQAINDLVDQLAKRVAESLNYVGVLGVEFFISEGKVFVNEIAPRPHNSGHYTIDATVTNQFEQQVRVLAGLPLGSARLHSSAVMVNLLGDVW